MEDKILDVRNIITMILVIVSLYGHRLADFFTNSGAQNPTLMYKLDVDETTSCLNVLSLGQKYD